MSMLRMLQFSSKRRHKKLEAYLKKGGDVDAVVNESSEERLLHIAARENDADMAELLLEHGASLSVATQHGWTPLMTAVSIGSWAVALKIVEHMQRSSAGAVATPDHDPWRLLAYDKSGLNILHALAKNRPVQRAQPDGLGGVQRGGSLGSSSDVAGLPSLRVSSTSSLNSHQQQQQQPEGDAEQRQIIKLRQYRAIVRLTCSLVAADQLTAKNPNGQSPLLLAVQRSNDVAVRKFLCRGADPNNQGHPVLPVAINSAAFSVIDWLLLFASDLDQITNLDALLASLPPAFRYRLLSRIRSFYLRPKLSATPAASRQLPDYRVVVVAPSPRCQRIVDAVQLALGAERALHFSTADDAASLGEDCSVDLVLYSPLRTALPGHDLMLLSSSVVKGFHTHMAKLSRLLYLDVLDMLRRFPSAAFIYVEAIKTSDPLGCALQTARTTYLAARRVPFAEVFDAVTSCTNSDADPDADADVDVDTRALAKHLRLIFQLKK